MTRRHSLALRLLAGAVLLVTSAMLSAGAVLSLVSRAQVEALYERELVDHLDQLTAQLELAGGALTLKHALSDPRFERPYGGRYWQAQLTSSPPLRSRSLWDQSLRLVEDEPAAGVLHRHVDDVPGIGRVRVVERLVRFAQDPSRPIRVAVALPAAEIEELAWRFDRLLALTLALLALVLLLGSALQVRIGLQPLRHLARAVAAVRSGTAQRLEGKFPKEVAPLADAFDQVLDQRTAMIERARAQASDLAHGLKTSLQVLLMQADELEASGSPTGGRMRQELQRLQALVGHQLARAQARGMLASAGERTSVRPSVEALLRVVEPLAARRGLAIACEVASDHLFAGDARDLEEMLGNLLDNACKWAKHRVAIGSYLSDGRLHLLVEDDGPGLEPAACAQAFARGLRLDERQPGHGLGLAIVRDLVALYGGEAALGRGSLGGLRAELVLPAA